MLGRAAVGAVGAVAAKVEPKELELKRGRIHTCQAVREKTQIQDCQN